MTDIDSAGEISFGDHVRVRSTALTRELELADLVGTVCGQTTPSVTDVEVIGELVQDYAINVNFEGRDGEYWFTEDLLEFMDHGAGTEIRLQGSDVKFTRAASGEWVEEQAAPKRKPWWKFW